MPTTERSEVPSPLMPFSSFPRIWSFSGRSWGFLLTYQRKVAPTTVFLPDHLWFLLVGGRGGVALVSAGRRHLSSYRVFRCMAPGRNVVAQQREGVCDEGVDTV